MGEGDVVDVRGLVVDYGRHRAVDGLDLRLPAGGFLGLLGGNGAGKTTTIAALLGLLLPRSGTIRLLGVDALRDRPAVQHRLNYASPYATLPARLSVEQNLRFFGHLYGVPGVRRRVREIGELLDLGPVMRRMFSDLSAGQRTRVMIGKALLNRPELLLLDEPTASLDPETALGVRAVLDDYCRKTGASVLLTSHNMGEVEELCDEIVVLGQGRALARGTPAALRAELGHDTLTGAFLDIVRADRDDT